MSNTDNGSATKTAKKSATIKAAADGDGKSKAIIVKPVKPIEPTMTPEQLLQKQLDSILMKHELIGVRNRFLETKAQLTSYLAEQGTDFDSEMDHNNLRVLLQDDRNYNDNPISISNAALVRDFCEFLTSRVNQKLIKIESQLLR